MSCRNHGGVRIGRVEIDHPVILAPMSGVSDLPFRQLAHRFGASMVVSEMVACADLVRGRSDVELRALGAGVDPFAIQLVGHDPHWMAEAARRCQALGADIVDINMGCPAREVTGRQSGSALMRDLRLAAGVIEAVVSSVDVPVTLKMRLGWDDGRLNAPELARIAEIAGVKMLTVHARTRAQFFKGHADWTRARAVVEATGLPVIINGDIVSFDDLSAALNASGADGVMVGRGAYGAPWLPGRLSQQWRTGTDPGAPGLAELAGIVREHVEAMLAHYGARVGLRNARKHVAWYLSQAIQDGGEVKRWRRRLCTEERPDRMLAGVAEFFDRAAEAAS